MSKPNISVENRKCEHKRVSVTEDNGEDTMRICLDCRLLLKIPQLDTENWIDEFEKFYYSEAMGIPQRHYLKIISFITNLLAQQREEAYEEGIKDEAECMEKSGEHHQNCQQETKDLIISQIEGMKKEELDVHGLSYEDKGYNQALEDIIAKLK